MIQIYTHTSEQIANRIQIYNDSFFNVHIYGTSFTEEEKDMIKMIDQADVVEDIKIVSPYGVGAVMDLSTGCKTILNILRYPEFIFSVDECGPNILELLFRQKRDFQIFMSYNQFFKIEEPFQVLFDNETEVTTMSKFQKYWEKEYARREEEAYDL